MVVFQYSSAERPYCSVLAPLDVAGDAKRERFETVECLVSITAATEAATQRGQ